MSREMPMMMTRGGYDTNASGCYPIAFWFDTAPAGALVGFERDTNSSQLIVQDTATQSRGMDGAKQDGRDRPA